MKTIELYSDGACHPNPGKGGWAYKLIVVGGGVTTGMNYAHDTTNNRMELIGFLRGLADAHSRGPEYRVIAYSDSKYVVDGTTKWIDNWRKRGWRTVEKKPVLNADIWTQLIFFRNALGSRLTVKWIKGHAGHEHNEDCDKLAVRIREKGLQEVHRSDLSDIPLFKA